MEPKAQEQHELRIIRIFDAPVALVYKVMNDADMALKWMGPRSHPTVHYENDFREGGTWRSCLRSPDGTQELWQGGHYIKIEEPNRVIFTFAWDDGPETVVIIDLTEVDGKTRMDFRQTPFETEENRDGHNAGWNSSFDRLADVLANA